MSSSVSHIFLLESGSELININSENDMERAILFSELVANQT
ncbi:hypothetical protein MNBD_GAMMA12-2076 [hydrothermal vent metagenome]|uniref:Uncharacterized protein n=1 Tax=hydrothermal vent metagenome TaxID=652676 RepID=A0A3B0Z3J7_9ZZZZ